MYERRRTWLLGLVLTLSGLAGCEGATTDAPTDSSTDSTVSVELRTDSRIVSPGESTTVEARISQSGENGSDGDSLSGVSWNWSISEDAWKLEGTGTGVVVTAPDETGARAVVRVEVTRDSGTVATDDLLMQTSRNRPPRVVDLSASPSVVDPGGEVALKAKAEDPDGENLTYEWSAPDGWTLQSAEGSEVALEAPDRAGAIGRASLKVSDGAGATAHRGVQVRTTDSNPPQLSGMIAIPPQVGPGGTAELSVDANDPGGGDLTYAWSAPTDWTLDGSGETVEVTAPDEYGARGTVSVEVSNSAGRSVTGRIVVATEQNGGPTISALTANPQQLDRGGSADLVVSADDPDGDNLSYSWSVPAMNWSVTGNGDSAVLDAPDEPGASASVEVEVTDGEGKSGVAAMIVATVPNGAPSVNSISANPAQVDAGGTSQLKVAASDPDGDNLDYSWTTPSGWSVSGQTADPTLQAPSSPGKTAILSVEVTDGFGGTSRGSLAVTTTSNRPPVISNVTASPIVVSMGGSTTLSVSASDPNGDSLSYNWAMPSGWTQNGSGATIDVQAPNEFDNQGTFEVTVTDGNGGQAIGATTAQTERNNAPVIASLTAGKTTLSPGASTDVTVEAGDPEGMSLTYSWSLPSGWSKSGSGTSITVTAPGSSGETGDITVDVSDGSDSSSDTITLQTN